MESSQVRIHVARKESKDLQFEGTLNPLTVTFLGTFPKWWGIAKIWFSGSDKWVSRSYLVAKLALSMLYTFILVQVSYSQKTMSTAMSDKKVAEFNLAVLQFMGIAAVAAPLFAIDGYVEERLQLAWRVSMTNSIMENYFSNRSFFLLNGYSMIDNPDQRICEDVRLFVEISVLLSVTLAKKLFNCIAFTGVLWTISPSLVVFLFVYTFLGTAFTAKVFGKVLMSMNYLVMEREADMRFELVRVRENAESIAFYSGDIHEKNVSSKRFADVVRTRLRRIKWSAGLSLWNNFYSYATLLVPSIITAPMYFSGSIEFGIIAQATYAFDQVEQALSSFVDQFQFIGQLAAQTQRLAALVDMLDDIIGDQENAGKNSKIVRIEEPLAYTLQLDSLCFTTPNGNQLIADGLDLTVSKGESLLIMGPSGCGKSSLLRAIAGLWTAGGGTVRTPPAESMFFLPQRPYMPLGTLRQQLLFPSSRHDNLSDAQLQKLLTLVQLPDLSQKLGGLDTENDWIQVLSIGEQQRIAFLRLIIHKPLLAFLDEATSAMDVTTEKACYIALMEQGCSSYVSVGHRPQLVRYHTHVLEYQGNGYWLKYPSSEFQKKSNFQGDMF